MSKKSWVVMILSAISFFNVAMAVDRTGPIPCKYNDDDGEPVMLFQRIEASTNDWYSNFKLIQFCQRPNGKQYVLIEEELIHGFKVINPASNVLSSKTESDGSTTYTIEDDLLHNLALTVSPDGETLDAAALKFGSEPVDAKLKLVWNSLEQQLERYDLTP